MNNPRKNVSEQLVSNLRQMGFDIPENYEFVRTRASLKMLEAGEPSWYITGTNLCSRFALVPLSRAASLRVDEIDGKLWVQAEGLTETGQRGGRRDLTGQKFHFLTVTGLDHSNNRRDFWKCTCERCGNTEAVFSTQMLHGRVGDCGCVKKSKEYRSLRAATERCTVKTNKSYGRYGGRGIEVEDVWKDRYQYLADVGPAPSEDHCLGRIDHDKAYGPTNVGWRTKAEECQDRCNTIRVVLDGVEMNVTQACAKTGVNRTVAYRRIKANWDPLLAVTAPVIKNPYR